MTMQAADAPMRPRVKREPRAEYWIYFALLFAVLLPATLLKRVVTLFTGGPSTESVLREAMSQAHTAAAMIFSA